VIRRECRAAFWTLTFDRPDARNALTPAMLRALVDGFDESRTRPMVRALVLRAAGPSFCAGGDFGAFRRLIADAARLRGRIPSSGTTARTRVLERLAASGSADDRGRRGRGGRRGRRLRGAISRRRNARDLPSAEGTLGLRRRKWRVRRRCGFGRRAAPS